MNGFRFGSSALIVSASAFRSARTMSASKLNCCDLPLRVVEHQKPELIEAGRSSRCGPPEIGPAQLAARLRAGDLPLRLSGFTSGEYISRAVSTCAGVRQLLVAAPCTARTRGSNVQRVGSSITPSFDAVDRVARLEHRVVKQCAIRRRADVRRRSLSRSLCDARRACAARPVQSRPGAPAMMPSKSAGNRCASFIACRPPAEQPFQYESFGAVP